MEVVFRKHAFEVYPHLQPRNRARFFGGPLTPTNTHLHYTSVCSGANVVPGFFRPLLPRSRLKCSRLRWQGTWGH